MMSSGRSEVRGEPMLHHPNSQPIRRSQKGAISMAETLIVLSVGIVVIALWAQSRLSQMEIDSARNAGRAIATYARAAATWLAESPPTANGIYRVNELQDCGAPNGRRFLSCTYGAATQISYLYTDSGDPMTFGDLEIDVTLGPSGTLGFVDFGVFRSGADANGDGLPDSRADLAAAAFQTATEETGAGVMDFFELTFAEADASAVIFDPNNPNYDFDKVENLARLQARVGVLGTGETPFLRIDGGNKMTGGLNFENGMQINMSTAGLQLEGTGNVEINTTSGDLVVTGNIDANTLQASSGDFDALNVDPTDGVTGTGFDRFDQAPDITRIDSEINTLTSRVTVNERGIQTNADAISANRREIVKNTADIDGLNDRVDNNTDNIAANRKLIDQNAHSILNISGSSIQNCTPSRESVLSTYGRRTSCSGICSSGCGRYIGISNTYSYQTRNSDDLSCSNHSIRIYSSCCFDANGNCDGGICGGNASNAC